MKPEDVFDIVREIRTITREDGSEFTVWSHYLIYKATGEKHFPKTRPYGYSDIRDAKRARTRLANDIIRTMEKELLGG